MAFIFRKTNRVKSVFTLLDGKGFNVGKKVGREEMRNVDKVKLSDRRKKLFFLIIFLVCCFEAI